MISVTELRKNVTFEMDGQLYKVLEYEHYKPGRGNAIIRTKIRNMRSGAIIPKNFLNGNKFEEAPVERLAAQYLYTDGEQFHFMDSATYEEYHISRQAIGDKSGFLKDGMEVALTI
ncbi:MAG TPA: elongation factor P, partial [Anaerolineae bacterium]|nr:elongation factor P [Anaerolineae bacterium]